MKRLIPKWMLGWLWVAVVALPMIAEAASWRYFEIAKGAQVIKFDAYVMEIDYQQVYMYVAEEKIFAARFHYDGKDQKTIMRGTDAERITLEDIKVGERVIIKGFRLKSGDIVAETIQKMPPRFKHKAIRLEPLQPQ